MDLPERSSQGGRLSLFASLSGLKIGRFARLFGLTAAEPAAFTSG
jgi:hypothetical protein